MWRRNFVKSVAGGAGFAAIPGNLPAIAAPVAPGTEWVPPYARLQRYRSRKQGSYDVTGGNGDSWPINAGAWAVARSDTVRSPFSASTATPIVGKMVSQTIF